MLRGEGRGGQRTKEREKGKGERRKKAKGGGREKGDNRSKKRVKKRRMEGELKKQSYPSGATLGIVTLSTPLPLGVNCSSK